MSRKNIFSDPLNLYPFYFGFKSKSYLMKKFEFTWDGFLAFQRAYYSLNDEILKQQGELVRNRIAYWVQTHFRLTVLQSIILMKIHPNSIALIQVFLSIALEKRLPLMLNEVKKDEFADEGKELWSNYWFVNKSSGSIGCNESGNLQININDDLLYALLTRGNLPSKECLTQSVSKL